ncbi:VOC family protein [Methylobacterium sp. JK268]
MSHPETESSIVLLYVTDPAASRRFYASVLAREPVEVSATFVLFVLPSGLSLGLWGASGVAPRPEATGGGAELGFKLASAAAVDAAHTVWEARGARILMPPTDLDFGRSFLAADPDGHRLRVYALAG